MGTLQEVTASTGWPVSRAWPSAQRNASSECDEPSTPTTMRPEPDCGSVPRVLTTSYSCRSTTGLLLPDRTPAGRGTPAEAAGAPARTPPSTHRSRRHCHGCSPFGDVEVAGLDPP